MKINACFFALASAGKGSKSRTVNEINGEACFFDEIDGVTTATTEEGLAVETKCYKRFTCPGAQVQVKINALTLGSHGVGDQFCSENFIKIEYRVEREDFQDFYNVEEKLCQESATHIDEWHTMAETVWFSFEYTEWDYYDWKYNYYAGADIASKYEVQFRCTEPVTPEPTTAAPTTPAPTTEAATTEPTTMEPTINPDYNDLESYHGNWDETIDAS